MLNILISGASSGIGWSCTAYLARAGYRVFAGYRKAEDAQHLQALSSNVTPILLDLTNSEHIHTLPTRLEALLDGQVLHALFNNAGMVVSGPLELVSIEKIRLQLEVNLIGHMAVTQALLPLLRQSQGRIINNSSISGLLSMPFLGPYCISKFAMEAWSDALRQEVQGFQISVSVIEPGSVKTAIWEKAKADVAILKSSPMMPTYNHLFKGMKKATKNAENKGISPEFVAQAVHQILIASKPKARYLIGNDAQKYHWLKFLPDTLKDWLVAQRLS